MKSLLVELLIVAASALTVACAAGEAKPPPTTHPCPWPVLSKPHQHPRLFASGVDLFALRQKVNVPGSLSQFIFAKALAKVPAAGEPDLIVAIDATAPMASLLCAGNEDSRRLARNAIDSSLALIRRYNPPYPNDPEWIAWFQYRYIVLTYDCCYHAMTDAERGEFQEELLRICALCAGWNVETTTNNHWVVTATVLGLAALALEGDVPTETRPIRDEKLVRGWAKTPVDYLQYRSGIEVESIGLQAGEATFVAGRDYAVKWSRESDSGIAINWLPGGQAPALGQAFFVTYRFTPDFPLWKDLARQCIQHNLDQTWCDGASLAGVMYGDFTLSWEVDLFEAMRRNMGVDFGKHPCVREIVNWLPTELIPGKGLRANNRDDSTYDGSIDGLARATPFLAWVMTRYRTTSTMRRYADYVSQYSFDRFSFADDTAYWLLSRGTEWQKHAGCREAMWLNDAYSGAPPLKALPPLELPLSHFFRGHDLANFRTGGWDGPMDQWSLFSLISGPFTMAEHDQTDKGSFTFYALGEDFAIDSGYAQGDARSDSTAAHNYLLVDGKGQIGPWGSSAFSRGHFLGDSMDSAHADLKSCYVHYCQWPTWDPARPWPMKRADRYVAYLKYANHAPVAVIADAMDRDGASHTYQWLLHTQVGNTIAFSGSGATIAGKHTGARLDVHLAATAPCRLSQDTWKPTEGDAHPRLIAETVAVNPGFLAVLAPETRDEAHPLQVTTTSGDGFRAATVIGATGRDLTVCTDGGSCTVGDIQTDAALAVVRLNAKGDIYAWTVYDATSLICRGKTLWRTTRPVGMRASACWDGTPEVIGPDLRGFEMYAPGLSPQRPVRNMFTWEGTRALVDKTVANTPVMRSDFKNEVSPYWFVLPLAGTGYTHIANGELCCPGLRHEWISYTHRNFNRNAFQTSGPPRADIFQWPRCIFGDAVLRGSFKIVEHAPGSSFTIAGRVSDRTYPDDQVDQDLVQVTVNPDAREFVLSIRLNGTLTPVARAPWVDLAGNRHAYAYEFALQGDTVTFAVDGEHRLNYHSADLPHSGYFQWEVAQGMHVHFGDVTITIPQ